MDVNAVVDDCLVLTRHNLDKRGIRVETRLDAHAGVEINRSELQQVLINLIVNAVQAMPAGGRLTLLSEVWLEQGLQLGTVIHVRDTGQGIAGEDLDRIFDPFFTTKRGSGTGLGLSISYTIVQRYGGRITVSSTPGAGSEFSVWLRSQPEYDDSPSAPGFEARWRRGPRRRGWRRAASEVIAASETFCRYRRARWTKCRHFAHCRNGNNPRKPSGSASQARKPAWYSPKGHAMRPTWTWCG